MKGAAHTSVLIDPQTNQAWKIVGTGNFNKSVNYNNILWRNTSNGNNMVWFMNGTTHTSVLITPETDQNWQIAKAADFNNDGNSDILWRNGSTGEVRVWYLNGTAKVGEVSFGFQANQAWTIVGAGDFNNDGQTDILWRNTTNGNNMVWLMSGTLHSGVQISPEVNQNWQIFGTGDFKTLTGLNYSRTPDIVWRNVSTGEVRVWNMDGVNFVSSTSLGVQANLAWKIAGQ